MREVEKGGRKKISRSHLPPISVFFLFASLSPPSYILPFLSLSRVVHLHSHLRERTPVAT